MTDHGEIKNKGVEQKVLTRDEQVKANVFIIEKTLESFGIYSRVVEVNILENTVHFSIEIALGTKIDDLLSLNIVGRYVLFVFGSFDNKVSNLLNFKSVDGNFEINNEGFRSFQ